jgi:hypothetical protein
MKAPTEKQTQFIMNLVSERQQTLANDHPDLLQHSLNTSQEASALIDALLKLPTDPREVDPDEQRRIDALKDNFQNLDADDRGFAQSLIDQWSTKGRLSVRQWVFVDQLALKTEATCDPQPGDIVWAYGNYYTVRTAKSGRPYALMLQGRNWEYQKRSMPLVRSGRILTGDELAAFAKKYGDMWKRCVFCALPLTDQRSVTAGYGETCASNNGLPWG